MDPAGSAYEGLYDPTKTKIPRRFQSKMPSLKHLKDNPCASLWSDVVECYALHSFDANACVSEMFAYNQCKKKVKPARKRMAEARHYLQNVMRTVREASTKARK